ncbi:hypothetical protein E1A91_D12G083400v1, partial [Gossypium mustelinum]
QSIPSYALSVFVAPEGILEKIQSMISRMWWSGKDKSRGWNRMAWDRVCFLKGMGGLGFRDLRRFNVALLGRQVWRLACCKDTLCFKVLRAKYFPESDVFCPKRVDKPSFTWNSIARAACILHEGFGLNVGNGRKINIWQENW